MRFILRCTFWLSVVYVSMAWHHGAFDGFHFDRAVIDHADVAAPVDAARHAALSVVTATKDQAVEFCRKHTSECVAEAARLGALFSSASASQTSAPAVAPDQSAVPLPVPDPRRHARDPRVAAAR